MFTMIATTERKVSLRPIQIVEKLRLNVNVIVNELDNYVYEKFQTWGLCPISKSGKINLIPTDWEQAKYPAEEVLTKSIIESFFNINGFNKYFDAPSREWMDAPSIAIRMGYAAQFGRSALNSYVISELKELGLCPYKGRHGAVGLAEGLNSSDGGVYPVNNPIVQRIVREFFEDLGAVADTADTSFTIRVSA